MWGGIFGAIAQAVPAVVQAVKGGEQKAKGEAGLASLKRPDYYDTLARISYGDKTMPGEVNMLDRNDLIAQNSYEQAKESGNPLASIPAIQAMNEKGARSIGVHSAQHREKDMLRLMNALKNEYQMNEFAPYKENSQEYRDMVGAGEKNQFSGISNMSGIASSVLSNMNFNPNDSSNYDPSAASTAGDAYKTSWGGKPNLEKESSASDFTYQDYLDARNVMDSMYKYE